MIHLFHYTQVFLHTIHTVAIRVRQNLVLTGQNSLLTGQNVAFTGQSFVFSGQVLHAVGVICMCPVNMPPQEHALFDFGMHYIECILSRSFEA